MATKKRLIDANALLTEVVKAQALEPDNAVAKIIMLITESKSVDAVEVVRCESCRRWTQTGSCRHGICHLGEESNMRWKHDYRSYGERKSE